MKVLHILYQSLPDISGSTIRSKHLIESQNRKGIEVVVATSPFQRPFNKNNREEYNGIYYYRNFNSIGISINEGGGSIFTKLIKGLYIFPFIFKLRKIVKNEKPDILHAHATFFTAASAIVCSKLYNIPIVYEVRSLWDERQKQSTTNIFKLFVLKLIRGIENTVMNLSDEIVTINDNLKKDLIKKGVKKRITVIKNAANLNNDLVFTDSNRKEKGLIFGYIGTLTVLEGLTFLVRQFEKLQNKNIKLLIFGHGPVLDEIKKIITTQNITNVELCGSFKPENIKDIYNQIDCVINPRIKNHLSDTVTPLKPLEALSYKKLFLGSDVGGIKELIKDGKTGILFKAEDSSSFLESINYICNNFTSNEINNIINNGYEDVKMNFSWESNTQKYLALYESMSISK